MKERSTLKQLVCQVVYMLLLILSTGCITLFQCMPINNTRLEWWWYGIIISAITVIIMIILSSTSYQNTTAHMVINSIQNRCSARRNVWDEEQKSLLISLISFHFVSLFFLSSYTCVQGIIHSINPVLLQIQAWLLEAALANRPKYIATVSERIPNGSLKGTSLWNSSFRSPQSF